MGKCRNDEAKICYGSWTVLGWTRLEIMMGVIKKNFF